MNENLGEIQLPIEVNGAIALKKEVSLNIETHDGSAVGRPTVIVANLPVDIIPTAFFICMKNEKIRGTWGPRVHYLHGRPLIPICN